MRAVLSVLGQTVPVCEIVIVDDASDPALDMEAFQSLDQRILVLRLSQNGGAARARQFGVDHAKGDIVAFLDSDDWWERTKLADQLPVLAASGLRLTAVACGWQEVDQNGGVVRTRFPRESSHAADFVSGCWFCPGSTVILPRGSFNTVGPLDSRLRRLEDLDWFARFGAFGGRLLVASTASVTISVGRRACSAGVEPAARLICEKVRGDRRYSSKDVRALEAWLEVERSRAHLNEGRSTRAACHLARSFALVPRLQLQLRRWWSTEAPSARDSGSV
jgi:glycosyltransferase involved in cell wall biosynthesis